MGEMASSRVYYSVLGCVCLLLFFLFVYNPRTLVLGSNYFYQVFHMIESDESREITLKSAIQAGDEWNMHKMYMKYYAAECTDSKETFAWMTALQNDKFILPTIVLGYLLNRLSCLQHKVVLVSDKVSQLGIKTLTSVGFQVRVVEGLDCNYMDRVFGRSEANKGIVGTHIRLLAFNLTNYDKVIYLDGDFFPLVSLDHVFGEVWPGKITAAYCSKPGVVDPCFNAGLIGVVPDQELFVQLMDYWKQLSEHSCPDDQRLLWYFFADQDNWVPLSYSYNVRRERYFPMRSFHFASHGREPRPWDWTGRPSREFLKNLDQPLHTVMDIIALWWKYLYLAIDEYQLHEFWESIQSEIIRK